MHRAWPFIRAEDVASRAADTFGGPYRMEQQRRACDLWARGREPRLRECGDRLMAEFIAARSAANLDVSCASTIPPVPFVMEKRP